MRPRFELHVPVERSAWLEAFQDALRDDSDLCRGQVFRRHAFVEIRDDQKRFWSPYLNIDLVDEPGGVAVRGRFSPHPHVWTLFMAIYILLGIAALAGLVYGLAQWILNEAPWAALGTPVAIALFAFVYGATLIGQGLGAEEMHVMRTLVDRASSAALADVTEP